MVEMVIIDNDNLIRLGVRKPALHRLHAVMPNLPARIEFSRDALVVLVAHRRRMRHTEAADHACHQIDSGSPPTRRGHASSISSTGTPALCAPTCQRFSPTVAAIFSTA